MFTRSLCIALLGAAIGNAALAETRTISSPWLDVRYDSAQLPDSHWQMWLSTGVIVYPMGTSWEYGGGVQLVLEGLTPGAGAFGRLDLALDFKGPVVTTLDGVTELVTRLSPVSTVFNSWSYFALPPGAVLPISAGLDQLTLSEGGAEVMRSTLRPVADASTAISINNVHSNAASWTGTPQGVGTWQITLEQQLVGSSHLLLSSDLGCTSLGCMPVQRSTADLQRLEAYIPMSFELRPVVAAVPEPGSNALLLAGCGVLAAALRRRSGRRVVPAPDNDVQRLDGGINPARQFIYTAPSTNTAGLPTSSAWPLPKAIGPAAHQGARPCRSRPRVLPGTSSVQP